MIRRPLLSNALVAAGFAMLFAASATVSGQPWCATPFAPCDPDDQNGNCYDPSPEEPTRSARHALGASGRPVFFRPGTTSLRRRASLSRRTVSLSPSASVTRVQEQVM